MYAIKDIVQDKGHIFTNDRKYYLKEDGHFDYWHAIRHQDGDKIKLSFPLGRHSYDFCFRNDLQGCVDKLNKILREKD